MVIFFFCNWIHIISPSLCTFDQCNFYMKTILFLNSIRAFFKQKHRSENFRAACLVYTLSLHMGFAQKPVTMENLRRDPLGRNALASLSHGDQHDKVPPFPHKISWHVGSKTEYLNPSFPVLIDSGSESGERKIHRPFWLF